MIKTYTNTSGIPQVVYPGVGFDPVTVEASGTINIDSSKMVGNSNFSVGSMVTADASLYGGLITIDSASVPEQLTTTEIKCKKVLIQADKDNAGNINVGLYTVDASYPLLLPGYSARVSAFYVSDIYIKASSDGDRVRWQITEEEIDIMGFNVITVSSGTVDISNWPSVQTVDGTVDIGNFPASQVVEGTVDIGNFPASQVVEGTVDIGNFPASQVVEGTVDIGNFPASQVVEGTVDIGNFPASQVVEGTVDIGNFPASQVVEGTVDIGNFPASQVVEGTVDIGNFPATQVISGTIDAITADVPIKELKILGNSQAFQIPTGTNPKEFTLTSGCKELWLTNPSTNTATFYVGINNSVTDAGKNCVTPGMNVPDFPVAGLSSVWIYASVLDEYISIQEIGRA